MIVKLPTVVHDIITVRKDVLTPGSKASDRAPGGKSNQHKNKPDGTPLKAQSENLKIWTRLLYGHLDNKQ